MEPNSQRLELRPVIIEKPVIETLDWGWMVIKTPGIEVRTYKPGALLAEDREERSAIINGEL
jgi:hypothetical protein